MPVDNDFRVSPPRRVMILVGYDVLSGHEVKLFLSEDSELVDPELKGTHEWIIQTEDMIKLVKHMGYAEMSRLFAGEDVS